MYILLSVNWFIFPSVNLTKTRWTTLNCNAAMESVVTSRLVFKLIILSYCMNIVEYYPKQNILFDEQSSAIAIMHWIVVQLFLLQWKTLKMTRAPFLHVDDVTI